MEEVTMLLASHDHAHMWGGTWWWLWGAVKLAFIVGAIWLLARGFGPRRYGLSRAREVLAERYARGELTADEYRERLEGLRK